MIAGKEIAGDLYKAAVILEEQWSRASEYQQRIGEFINPNHPLVILGPDLAFKRQDKVL
jgi:hypothetical protein